ncbi:MAG TPA: hypothetical protein VE593_10805 [Nitrososphaeraceae archaeon]|jgi:hypothetical protein|nr:hypothetical protein [Nitrososphaeraceae archaeon]
MINISEIDIPGSSSSFLNSMSYVTLVLSIIPLGIFVWLAVRSKNTRAFQFQISIFIAVYILGEIIENNMITVFSVLPPDFGPQIHVSSAIFFMIMVWFRFYYTKKSGKKMIESVTDNGNSDNSLNSTNT